MGNSSGGMNLAELNAEILAMPEHRLYQQLHGFSLSIYIFDRNFVDLKCLIEFLIKDPRARRLTASRNRDQLQTVQQEIIRFLHNFVASAQSLIDHTRKLHTKLYGESGFPEYQQKVASEFKNDPLSQFVKCLRQYAEHYKAPEVAVVSSLSRNDTETTQRRSVELLLEDLQAFEGWTSKAKQYLGTQKRGTPRAPGDRSAPAAGCPGGEVLSRCVVQTVDVCDPRWTVSRHNRAPRHRNGFSRVSVQAAGNEFPATRHSDRG